MLSNENPALMGPRRLTLTAYVAVTSRPFTVKVTETPAIASPP